MDMRAMALSWPTNTGTQPLSHWCTALSCTLSMRGMLGPHRSTSRIPTWGQAQPFRQAQQRGLSKPRPPKFGLPTALPQQPHLKHKQFKFHIPPDLLLLGVSKCFMPEPKWHWLHRAFKKIIREFSLSPAHTYPFYPILRVLELTHFTPQRK